MGSSTKELTFWAILWICFILLIAASVGCTTQVYDPAPLAQTQLRFRPGDVGPSQHSCTLYKAGVCQTWVINVLDVRDPAIRARMAKASMYCFGGGKRYYFCQDRPGLCTQTRKCDVWVFGCRMVVEYLPLPESQQQLVDSNVHCGVLGGDTYEQLFPKAPQS